MTGSLVHVATKLMSTSVHTLVDPHLAIMDGGYDSDYGCADFTSVPTLQVFAAVTYEEYCRKTAHKKSEGKMKGKGKLKDKIIINCHARDLCTCSTPAAFMSVISAVSVGQRVYSLEPGSQLKPPVVSNEPSIYVI